MNQGIFSSGKGIAVGTELQDIYKHSRADRPPLVGVHCNRCANPLPHKKTGNEPSVQSVFAHQLDAQISCRNGVQPLPAHARPLAFSDRDCAPGPRDQYCPALSDWHASRPPSEGIARYRTCLEKDGSWARSMFCRAISRLGARLRKGRGDIPGTHTGKPDLNIDGQPEFEHFSMCTTVQLGIRPIPEGLAPRSHDVLRWHEIQDGRTVAPADTSGQSIREKTHCPVKLVDCITNMLFIHPTPASAGEKAANGMKPQIVGRNPPDRSGSQ
ncbi:hypothetical protein WR25_00519 [Diploscapter pachys]|uniref:Uncharacterized protein n=1 Tax=Diploscapter pachys TaxID=2018661 RepID=A0A2A2KKU0_9BILA|nr:hypothetical protein WR25_00519 [Diploscapter pachys]